MERIEDRLDHFRRELLELGPLAPADWRALADRCTAMHVQQGGSLMGFPGDLFFAHRGLIKEVQEGTLVDRFKPSIPRLLKEGDVFFIPLSGQRNTLQAIEDTALLRISRMDSVILRREHPRLVYVFEDLLEYWYGLLEIRQELLLIPKRHRYEAFAKEYPGLAARLLDKDLMVYLDVSRGHFSRSK